MNLQLEGAAKEQAVVEQRHKRQAATALSVVS
jgi:hypothetical protein